jgi:hypothetical protein
MNCNEPFLYYKPESDAGKEDFKAIDTYHKSDAENSSNKERRTSSEFFLERITQPCSSVALFRIRYAVKC